MTQQISHPTKKHLGAVLVTAPTYSSSRPDSSARRRMRGREGWPGSRQITLGITMPETVGGMHQIPALTVDLGLRNL